MTETEKELASRYGLPNTPQKKEMSISEIIAIARQNAVANKPQPQDDWDEARIGKAFISYYTQLVNYRNKALVAGDDFMERSAQIVQWIAGGMYENRWLYLTGDVGNGKSTTAKAICAVLNAMGNKVMQKKAADIALLYKYVDTQRKALDEYNALCMCPVLNIDDFGEESPAAMQELLDKRYDNMAITIFSTNIQFDDCERYGKRIFDRMCEMTERITFYEESYRRR